MITRARRSKIVHAIVMSTMLFTSACAMVDVPDARNVSIPTPVSADSRQKAVNERPDSVMYLPLGEDVLVPEAMQDDDFPSEIVGPFELRGETLAGALQLILADYDISLAFETQEGLTRRITVANLRGDLGKVVHQMCSLANLYCSYEDGTITIKDRQTFTVTLPPIGSGEDSTYLKDVAEGLKAILQGSDSAVASTNTTTTATTTSTTAQDPIVDATTRTVVYSATQRTADIANRYFQRLRANTAMIVFETYIWEVSLDSGNSTGIDWSKIQSFGKFSTSFALDGSVSADFLSPISIGLPTTQDINGTPTDLIQFLSQFGAVKTISQPQITVLSGSEAELRVADTQNFVSQIATTLDDGQATTSVNTDSVDTGFTLTIKSSWDKATVYANVAIELTDVKEINDFTFSDSGAGGGETKIQLPQTSERQLSTQIRVRPGDSVLIAGLVRENDNFDSRGVGLMKPLIPHSRTAQTQNLELVILLRPRVIVYTASNDKRYVDYAMKKHKQLGTGVEMTSPAQSADYKNVAAPVAPLQETIPDGVPAPLTAAPKVERAAPVPSPVSGYTPPAVSKSVDSAPLPPPVMAPSAPAPQPLVPPPSLPAPVSAPVPIIPQPAPAPVTPSWDQGNAAPPSAPAPASPDSRFGLGGGYTSKASSSSVSVYDAAPAQPAAVPVYSPNADAGASVYDLPPASPAPSSGTGSAYETYDYYTPNR